MVQFIVEFTLVTAQPDDHLWRDDGEWTAVSQGEFITVLLEELKRVEFEGGLLGVEVDVLGGEVGVDELFCLEIGQGV